jgi:hypothetical protein
MQKIVKYIEPMISENLGSLRAQSRQSAKLFLQSSVLGLLHQQASVPPPPFGCGGGGVPIPTRGHTLWYSRIYMYFVACIYFSDQCESKTARLAARTTQNLLSQLL